MYFIESYQKKFFCQEKKDTVADPYGNTTDVDTDNHGKKSEGAGLVPPLKVNFKVESSAGSFHTDLR